MSFPGEIEFIVSQNDKGDNPKRPDYRGEVKFAGQVYELAAWKRTKQGTDRKFISGKLTLKRPKEDPGAFREPEASRPAPANQPKSEIDEDVPF